jgi:arsenate reductase-like glutaredoxin family protein
MIELELGNTFSDVNEILINDKIYYALKELESSRIYFRSPSITKEKIETFKKNLETYSNELRNFEKDKFKAQAWKDYNKLQDEEAMKLAYENSVKFITNWKCGKIQ